MYLQLDTRFNPFTYDEMVKPLLYYKQAYDEAEAAYSDLARQTEAWKDIANREKSPEAFEMYQRYSGDLSRAVDDFSRGMTAKNRRALVGLKRRYAQDIEPIAKASKKIDELAAEQRKLSASNPDLMYDTDFSSEVSIDQMLENPNMSYKAVDGRDLYNKGAALTKAMASRMHKVNPALKNQYFEIKNGFGEEAANQFLLDSNAFPELNKALDDLVAASGVTEKNATRAYQYAKQGALSGMVGSTSYQADKSFERALQAQAAQWSREDQLIKRGELPRRTDADGTQHFYDAYTNEAWIVDKEGNRTDETINPPASGSQSSIIEVSKRLQPDPDFPGYHVDPQTGKRYLKGEDGTPSYVKDSEIPGYQSKMRRRAWMNAHPDWDAEKNPYYISWGTIDEEGDPVKIDGTLTDHLANKRDEESNISYESLPSEEIKKWAREATKANNLDVSDVTFTSFQGKGKQVWGIMLKPDRAISSNIGLDMNVL